MRSSDALSFVGSFCVVFGLGLAAFQLVAPRMEGSDFQPSPAALECEDVGLPPSSVAIVVGAGLILAGAYFERRSSL